MIFSLWSSSPGVLMDPPPSPHPQMMQNIPGHVRGWEDHHTTGQEIHHVTVYQVVPVIGASCFFLWLCSLLFGVCHSAFLLARNYLFLDLRHPFQNYEMQRKKYWIFRNMEYGKVSKERLIVGRGFQRKGQELISSVAMLSQACFYLFPKLPKQPGRGTP